MFIDTSTGFESFAWDGARQNQSSNVIFYMALVGE